MKQLLIFSKATFLLSLLLLTQACSPTPAPSLEVAAAYETSGIMPVKPYTRTIFSSTNW